METQNARVLYLLKQGVLKSEDAVYKHGMPRIASRINELKDRGYNIEGFYSKINGKSKYFYQLKPKEDKLAKAFHGLAKAKDEMFEAIDEMKRTHCKCGGEVHEIYPGSFYKCDDCGRVSQGYELGSKEMI